MTCRFNNQKEITMLVLSRKISEQIYMFDPESQTTTVVKLLCINGGQAKLGIDSPESVIIDREEIFKQRLSRATIKSDGRVYF